MFIMTCMVLVGKQHSNKLSIPTIPNDALVRVSVLQIVSIRRENAFFHQLKFIKKVIVYTLCMSESIFVLRTI